MASNDEHVSAMIDRLVEVAYADGLTGKTAWSQALMDERNHAIRALSAQQPEAVAWILAYPDGSISNLAAVYRHKETAENHIASYGGSLDMKPLPLYLHAAQPQVAVSDDWRRLAIDIRNLTGSSNPLWTWRTADSHSIGERFAALMKVSP